MEQLVFLIILAAISLIQWILQKSAEHKQKRQLQTQKQISETETLPESSPPPILTKQEPTPEQQLRELFEALGLPLPAEKEETVTPPTPPKPTTHHPPQPEHPSPVDSQSELPPSPQPEATPPPSPPAPPPLEPQQPSQLPLPTPLSPLQAQTLKPPPDEYRALAQRLQRVESTLTPFPTSATPLPFQSFLTSPHSLQQAIILTEILGPPRAFRDSSHHQPPA
ncbi:MAG: hypothetical protein N2035_06055 [Chthoniobacterales bacterium]|nr:hypothetical protein [Chthoniobacterales bacterium]